MSFINMNFSYDDIRSEEKGVSLIALSDGMQSVQMFANTSLSYDIIQGNQTPYYYSETKEPLKIKMRLSTMEEEWTSQKRDEISRWLNNGKFNKFYSTDDVNRVYYLKYIGSPTLDLVSGTYYGYIDIEFQNMDCYVRSNPLSELFDLSENVTETIIEVDNRGSSEYSNLYISFQKIGVGNVEIVNLTDSGRTCKVTNLLNNEEVTINPNSRSIESNLNNRYLHSHFNNTYLKLTYGVNRLLVKGRCKLKLDWVKLYNSY